jgi:3-oxoacyl-[acyl-carrier-protein] synthase-3
MSKLTIRNVKIAGMSACAPKKVEENLTLPIFESEEEAQKVIASTGIERRHVVESGTTASDLACESVNKLLDELNWERESVDLLAYVCQSRDFIAPQTACILQDRLGLSQGCCAIDLPFGCSGFVHGMCVAGSMMSQGGFKRGLLINAETNSINRSQKDRTVKPLFGDAATVTALEYQEGAATMNFVFGVDGSGYQSIWTKFGGMRYPTTVEALQEVEIEPGVIRRGVDMEVKGMDVFGFAIKRPPRSLKELIETFSIELESIDYLLLHQANKFIDEKIRKSLKIPEEKVPYCLHEYGNVTSASIPLTLVSQCKEQLSSKPNHCIACGFGVGLEWASMEFFTEPMIVTDIVEY